MQILWSRDCHLRGSDLVANQWFVDKSEKTRSLAMSKQRSMPPFVVRSARLLNRTILSKVGVNIVRNSSYGLARDVPEWAYRMLYFERLLDLVENVKGDIVECGVAKGQTILIFSTLIRHAHGKHVWGFDSFEGLPAPVATDMRAPAPKARKGLIRATESDVWDSLIAKTGFDEGAIRELVTLVRGWFADTLPHFSSSISLLHLDADLYESTKCALENLWPKVSVGGVVALDDYSAPGWPGAKKAVDEYLEPHFKNEGAKLCRDSAYGAWYVVKLK